MAADHLKNPYAQSTTLVAAQRAAHMAALLGKGLPCQVVEVLIGPIVTVSFQINSIFTLPNITMPVITSQYVRPSIQVGDYGRAIPTGAQIATIAGLSSGTADFGLEGNLSTLAFEPISNGTWSEQPGGLGMTLFQGKDGVVVQDLGGKTVVTVSKTTGVNIAVQSGTVVNVTAGGSTQPVKLADGTNSTTLKAQ